MTPRCRHDWCGRCRHFRGQRRPRSPSRSGNRTAVLLLNRAPVALPMRVDWEELGVGGAADRLDIYDVLRQAALNTTGTRVGVGGYNVTVPSHDVAFVIVSLQGKHKE